MAYVEKNEYCQKIIKQRQLEGWFDEGEIYGDIAVFNKNNAHQYKGKIDVITGGFPCQPFSVAGKQKGTSDDRYLFDEIIKTIKIIQPRWLFFENVPGLFTSNAIIEIYKSLDRLGYQCKPPLVLGSADCGNIHKRERVWIYATNTPGDRGSDGSYSGETGCCETVTFGEIQEDNTQWQNGITGTDEKAVFHASDSEGKFGHVSEFEPAIYSEQQKPQSGNCAEQITDPDNWSQRVQGGCKGSLFGEQGIPRCQDVRSIQDIISRSDIPQPLFCGMDDELPDWKQQLKAVGNGQDPVVMATAWSILSDEHC